MTRTRNLRRRRGATAVEFALCLPILLLVVFAALEFCRANMLRHTADNAAYEGARRAIVPGATAEDAREFADAMLDIVGTKDATVDVQPAVIESTTPEVTVTITVPMNSNGWFAPIFFKDKTLVTAFKLSRERYEQAIVP